MAFTLNWAQRSSASDRGLKPSPRPKRAGFSLIETLMAIGLGGILSLIAAPKLAVLHRQYQFASALSQLTADIGRARMHAVAQNRYVRVRVLGSDGYAIERSTDGVSYVQMGNVIHLPSPVTTAGGSGPTFNRSGLAGAVTLLTVTNGIVTKQVRTNMVGRVSIQ